MSQSLRSYPNAQRLLLRMPEAIRAQFSLAQLEAIELALVPRTHRIDIRFLLPLMGKGAYFVLAAGPNRRSTKRSSTPRSPNAALNELQGAIGRSYAHRTPNQAMSALRGVIDMSQAFHNSPNAYRMFQRIPKSVAMTFTPQQVQAIETALIPRSHLIDVRLSLPLMGKGAYLVLAAGPDTRSHYKDIQNSNPFVMPTVFASVVMAALSIGGLVQLRGSALLQEEDPVFANEEFHPTVVPFKTNRADCLESGRQWIDNQCIDETHDPDF